MDEQQQNHHEAPADDGVSIAGPMGWKATFPGRYINNTVLFLACAAAVVFMIRDHDVRQTEYISAAVQTREKQMQQFAVQVAQLQDATNTLLYVLTLPQNKRDMLHLDMPASLRAKLLQDERTRREQN